MRELDEKEGVIKSVQDQADILLQQNHPARLTIEVRQSKHRCHVMTSLYFDAALQIN